MACPGEWVDNAPLREAWEKSGVSLCELAQWLGYARGSHGDEAPVRRALGLKTTRSRGFLLAPQSKMLHSTALRYAEALSLDPIDVGL